MRIVQYHPRAASGDGGISNSVRQLSEAFARAGAEPAIVSDLGAVDDSEVEWRPVRHRRIGSVAWPPALDHAFAGADYIVLNSAWNVHNILAARAAVRLGIPYILAPRGAYDPLIVQRHRAMKRAWWYALERRLVRRAAAIHVFFASQADHLASLGYRGDVIVAPNGVAVPDEPRWSGDGSFLLYVGRFDPEHKGLDMLVQAAARLGSGARPVLRLHGPDWRGGKPRLRALVRQLRCEDRVQIGDSVYGDVKFALMAGACGFVYPSRWEGFGNAVAEAGALGVPTLVTPYALGEYLAARDAAILASPSIDGILSGLRRLMERPAEIGANARRIIRTEFTWDAVAQSWLDQLRQRS